MPTAPLPKGFEAPPCSGSSLGDMAVAPVALTARPFTGDAEAVRRETPEEALARVVKRMRLDEWK